MPASPQPFLPQLIGQMQTRFSQGETVDLCLHFDLTYDDLPGQGNAAKIRELVLYLARQQRLEALLAHLRRERPFVTWPDIPSDFSPPASSPGSPASPSPGFNIGQVKGSNVNIGGIQHIGEIHVETSSKPLGKEAPAEAADPAPGPARLEALVDATPSLLPGPAAVKAELAQGIAEMIPLLAAAPPRRATDVGRVVKSMESLHKQLQDPRPEADLVDMYTQALQRAAARLADEQPGLEPLVARIATAVATLLSG